MPDGRQEWGEFFPFKSSKFPYNETVAFEYAPMTKEQTLAKGLMWTERETDDQEEADRDPDALSCKECGKNYKVIFKESDFYKKFGLGAPESCYDCRHKVRFAKRNSRHMHDRECGKCGKGIRTTYAPEQPELVYCEECYREAIY